MYQMMGGGGMEGLFSSKLMKFPCVLHGRKYRGQKKVNLKLI